MRQPAHHLIALASVALAGCSSSPCRTAEWHRIRIYSRPFVGRWTVAHGDTLTLPQLGDRFRLTRLVLDSDTLVSGPACFYRGALVFSVPKAETLAISWFGQADRALVYGWPAELGPFGGLALSRSGDSLRGALLFDSRMGIRVRPGVTAQFVAGPERGPTPRGRAR
ncbi:MAG TPA: hypothetical protein VFK78_01880 [Gemmatimonadales bacterium]|nr:hypothetical protein [Gemmatimonadales bacterium]